MSDNEVAPLETAFGVDHHVSRAEAPERPVQDGGPEMVQLLNPEGERVSHPEHDAVVDALSDEELRGFYRDLVLIRRFDAEATALQRQGELGLWASLLGQEAAQVGSGRALRPQDYAFPTYREHGVAWCRGVDPVNLLGMFRGVNHGGWDPNEKNFHLYTIIIGAQTLHATGYAMGVQRDGSVGTGDDDRDTAVIAYFGDGATSQGDVSEALVFAGVNNSPVVFFCQNNQWAISEPNEKQTRAPLWHRARGFGFPGIRVDGNDVLAVYAVTKARARRRPLRPGPDLHRGLHLPDGRAHHLRRPHQVPRLRRGRGLEAPRPDRALQALARPPRAGPTPTSSTPSRRSPTSSAPRCASAAWRCPTPPGTDMFDHVYAEAAPAHRARAGRVRALPGVVRGGALMAATTLAKGITSGLRAAMEKDPKVVLMGEDIGKLGGVFRVTEGLQKDFGEDRVIDTPLAEAGILGTAIGMALRGYRPVVEIQFDGFVYPAFDHIVSQVAKLRARSLGPRRDADRHPHPVRRRHRRGRAPQRVQRGLLRAHRRPAGRRLLQPARRALDDPAGDRDRRPRRLLRAQAPLLGQGRGRRRPPRAALGTARVLREGTDLTLLAYGPMVKTCLQAAQAAEEEGRSPRGRRPALALAARRARPSSPRRARPAGSSSCTRPRRSSAWAPRSRR